MLSSNSVSACVCVLAEKCGYANGGMWTIDIIGENSYLRLSTLYFYILIFFLNSHTSFLFSYHSCLPFTAIPHPSLTNCHSKLCHHSTTTPLTSTVPSHSISPFTPPTLYQSESCKILLYK